MEKIKILLIADRSNGYPTRNPRMYIYDNVSLNSPQNENFSNKSRTENQDTRFMLNIGICKSCRL